ncbi:MAG: cytochrome P450 [Acidobacteriota bacterium]
MASATSSTIDLRDPELYLDGTPHALFTQLRTESPVYWNPEPDDPRHDGFWAITKYDDIVTISKNPKIFSSDADWGGHRIFDEEDRRITGEDDDAPSDVKSMISMDPPEHSQYRKTVLPGLMSRRVLQMEEGIRRRARTILDDFEHSFTAEETPDFVEKVAVELPIQMLAELFQVPAERQDDLFRWSNAIVAEDDPDMRASEEYMAQVWQEMSMYALELYQERMANPSDDLISMMVHSRIDGEPMKMERYLGAFGLLIVAGNETTRNSISGGLMALADHPEQRRQLVDHPELIAGAAREIVRWVSPVTHMRRTATQDTEIRDQTIRRGEKVVLWYCSANRDEDAFDDPFHFDVERQGPMQLGFGTGQHFCLGARLAELQLRVVFEELLPRFPKLEPVGEVKRLRSNFIAGIKEMRVRKG